VPRERGGQALAAHVLRRRELRHGSGVWGRAIWVSPLQKISKRVVFGHGSLVVSRRIAVIRQKLDAALDVWFFHTPMYVYVPVYAIVFTPIMIGIEELARYLGILAALDRYLFG
jgi:hypothetical protein